MHLNTGCSKMMVPVLQFSSDKSICACISEGCHALLRMLMLTILLNVVKTAPLVSTFVTVCNTSH